MIHLQNVKQSVNVVMERMYHLIHHDEWSHHCPIWKRQNPTDRIPPTCDRGAIKHAPLCEASVPGSTTYRDVLGWNMILVSHSSVLPRRYCQIFHPDFPASCRDEDVDVTDSAGLLSAWPLIWLRRLNMEKSLVAKVGSVIGERGYNWEEGGRGTKREEGGRRERMWD